MGRSCGGKLEEPMKDSFSADLSSYAEAGRVFVRDAPWSDDFLYELSVFPCTGSMMTRWIVSAGGFQLPYSAWGSDLAVYGCCGAWKRNVLGTR